MFETKFEEEKIKIFLKKERETVFFFSEINENKKNITKVEEEWLICYFFGFQNSEIGGIVNQEFEWMLENIFQFEQIYPRQFFSLRKK